MALLETLGAIGSIAGGVGSLASAFGGGGGGGGGFIGFGSPGGPALQDVFGTRLIVHEHGDDAGLAEFINVNPNAPLGSRSLSNAVAALNQVNLPTGFESTLLQNILQGGTLQDQFTAAGQQADITGDALLAAILSGGAPVDPTPLFDEAIRNFGANILPQVAEVSPLGVTSSGFLNVAGREGANLLGQAALAGVQLEDAARNRLASFFPQSLQAASARAAIPLGIASDVFGLGSRVRAEQEAQLAQPIGAFSTLQGLSQNQPFFQQGFPTTDSSANLIAAFGSAAPSILSGLGTLFGGGGGPSPVQAQGVGNPLPPLRF